MKYNSFEELEEVYFKALDEEKFEEALNILDNGMESLPEDELENHLFTIMDDKCYFAFKCGKIDVFINTTAFMLKNGFLCDLEGYRDLEGYNLLEEDERFNKLKEKNDLLLKEAQEKAKFKYIVDVPKEYSEEKKYPLFINLHGDGDNLEYHRKYWKPDWLLSKGFIVVYPQSSQVIRHESYGWISNEWRADRSKEPETYSKLYNEIKTCYDSICSRYSVDKGQVIIGGFSGGAVGAIDIALANIIPVKGVITISALKPKNFNEENVKAALQRNVKWVFMDGEKDKKSLEYGEKMIKEFKKQGVSYEYYINKGIGHWYPEDLDDKLDKALSFILE